MSLLDVISHTIARYQVQKDEDAEFHYWDGIQCIRKGHDGFAERKAVVGSSNGRVVLWRRVLLSE